MSTVNEQVEKLEGLVKQNSKVVLFLLAALIVVVIVCLYYCYNMSTKEGMSGRFWASGGGACALQSSDDIRFANSGCSAEGYINASVMKKDNFVPGPELKDANGNPYVIDKETGLKWFVLTMIDPDTNAPKKVYTQNVPMNRGEASTLLQKWGVDPAVCVPTDEGKLEDAWGWLTGKIGGPGEPMSDTKLIRVSHGY